MKVSKAIQEVSGFRYMMDRLNVRSGLGKRYLYELSWLTSVEEIRAEQDRMKGVIRLKCDRDNSEHFDRIDRKLMQIRDIKGTVKHIGDACVLDDLELFELKSFALLSEEIREQLGEWDFVDVPELNPVVRLLDPEGTRVPHFYIYDAYSEELAALRREIKRKKEQGEDEAVVENLYFQSVEMEDAVRLSLSEQISPYYMEIKKALEQVALLDVLLAKVQQASDLHLCCPDVSADADGVMIYRGLFHPELKMLLEQEGKKFQHVDIEIPPLATLITGANMAGKTVLLKSVALVQHLTQFGFFVPASSAVVQPVEKIMTCIGDEQDELNGLSSFAAEMLRVNEIICQVNAGKKVLVLIDELARTTNPVEGKAIVNGVLDVLSGQAVRALVTTHYSGITAECRHLRVKGFIEGKVQGRLTLKNINEYIDYSLVEEKREEAPREAIRIARMLEVDGRLLDRVENYLDSGK